MNFIFGVTKDMSLREAFIAHHNICPSCKSNTTRGQKKYFMPEGLWRTQRICACKAEWIPDEPTKANLERFRKYRQSFGNEDDPKEVKK